MSNRDRDDEDDASSSDRLLPSNGHSASEKPTLESAIATDSAGEYDLRLCGFDFKRHWRRVLAALCILGAVSLALYLQPTHHVQAPHVRVSPSGFSGPRNAVTFGNGTRFVQPPEVKIIGIIFFGRRQFVRILECYLRRNLKVNGGMLDEIHFLMHTDKRKDLRWLRNLVHDDNMGEYYKLKEDAEHGDYGHGVKAYRPKWSTFRALYKKYMTDPNAIYIKMDDDLMYVDDYAIAELVRVTLENPEAHSIQANIVNNRWNQWHHLRTGAIWPYLPEHSNSGPQHNVSWRPSELPRYSGKIPSKKFHWTNHFAPPSKHHRWLPLEPFTYKRLAQTPYGHFIRNPMEAKPKVETDAWTIGAQAHYSFFENYERGELMRFDYGSFYDHTWNQWYSRYNINMMAIRGTHVSLKPHVWAKTWHNQGDEVILSMRIPKKLNMPVLIATRAIAAHYSFKPDRPAMLTTDILKRYESLANQLYCNRGAQDGDDGSASEDEEIGDGPQDLLNPEDDYVDEEDGDDADADDDDDDSNPS